MHVHFFNAYTYCHLYFIIEFVCVLLDFTKKIIHREFLLYVANARGSWFLMKGAPPQGLYVSGMSLG